MYIIQTLENSTLDEIADVFNLAFSDYIVPASLTKQQLEAKMLRDNIRLNFSTGAYLNGKLIAFILHGFNVVDGKNITYNSGTGVIPSERGNGLTAKMYEFILPVLKSQHVSSVQLEVISTNTPAIKTYKKAGFTILRDLCCFKGSVTSGEVDNKYDVRVSDGFDWSVFQSFWDVNPSWQNSISAIENVQLPVTVAAYQGATLLGYSIYNLASRQIQQLAVSKNYRRKGVAKALVNYITQNYGNEMVVINVDNNLTPALSFFDKLGLSNYINQHEMIIKL